MPQKLDIENWSRKDHYYFFKSFTEPFWGLTFDLDCSIAYSLCKENGFSFFLYYLHKALVAVNAVEPLKYRIRGEEVIICDVIDGSSTIKREDHTFDFSFIPFDQDFIKFQMSGKKEIERIQNGSGLNPGVAEDNIIHFSSLPWIKFTSISHARNYAYPDSCPKISFGKLSLTDDKVEMPVSIHVHHGLVDAYHVSQFIKHFQEAMNQKS